MAGTIQCGRRSRQDFGKIPSIVEIPNLIEVQKRSYETFLQKDVPADRREEIGLQAVFKSVFPDRRLQRQRAAGVRLVPLRRAEVHGRGVPRPRHDLRHPPEGHAAPGGLRPRQRGQDPHHPRAARPGSLPGRAAADDRQGHVHHQRHRARGGQPAAALGRRVLRRRQGQDARLGQAAVSRRASFPTAAPGSSSTSTPTTSCTCAWTAGARCYATAFLRAFWFLEKSNVLSDEEILAQFYDTEEVLGFEDGNAWVKLHPDAQWAPRWPTTSAAAPPRAARWPAGKCSRQAGREARRGQRREDPGAGRGAGRAAGPPRASWTPRAARCCWPDQRGDHLHRAGPAHEPSRWRRSSSWC